MTRSFKKILIMVWIIPVFLLFFWGCESSKSSYSTPNGPLIIKNQTEESFTHEVSGMVFPGQVGDFKIQNVTFYNEAGDNISVEYLAETLGFVSALVEVYIYPASTGTYLAERVLGGHFNKQKDFLLGIFPSAYEVEEGQITIGQPFGPQQGMMLQFKTKESGLITKKEFYEKLYLFEHGKWFIKYRVTNPVGNEKDMSKKIGQFMHLLKWPEIEN